MTELIITMMYYIDLIIQNMIRGGTEYIFLKNHRNQRVFSIRKHHKYLR